MKPIHLADSEEDALVAPGEIRELLARLTEQSVEAIPAGEARTLEGLSVETGIPVAHLRETLDQMRQRKSFTIPTIAWLAFIFLTALTVWLVRLGPNNTIHGTPPATPAVVEPVPDPVTVQEPDLNGTLPLTSVTFGPDAGEYVAETGFQPSQDLPEGVSVSAISGNVVYGNGDHHSKVLQRLSPEDRQSIRKTLLELLKYSDKDADKRNLPSVPAGNSTKIPKGWRLISLNAQMYYGTAQKMVSLPPIGPEHAAEAERIMGKAVDEILKQLENSLHFFETSNRMSGP